MTEATLLWSIWQALLRPFVSAFTRLGYRRFVEWVTALALNVEEHTITQSVLAIDRPADWKALESFAEYGAWDAPAVTRNLTRLVAQAPGRIGHGYHVSAVDDTKVHRNSQDVWGTCTFHEYTSPGQKLRFLKGLEPERQQGLDRSSVLALDPFQTLRDRCLEPGEVFVVPAGQALLLHELPQPLDQVQVRRVGGQEQQLDPEFLGQLLDQHAPLIAGVVQDQRQR